MKKKNKETLYFHLKIILSLLLSHISAQIALPTFQGIHKPSSSSSSSSLYSFSSQTFTNCGVTGNTGPTLSDCTDDANYSDSWTDNTSYFNIQTQGIQEWTVPQDATYRIVASGAAGGTNGFGRGGYGATITVDVDLTEGQILAIVVGQMGTGNSLSTNYSSGTGGGGGTFVYEKSSVTYYIAVAGGGGAKTSNSNLNSDTDDADGKYNSTSGTTIYGHSNSYVAAGGTSGSGGSNSTRGILYGGAGAGVNSNGATHSKSAHGLSRSSGWLGGTGTYYGGFGGGGGGSCTHGYKWAGGGGGYSGGGCGHNVGSGDGQYGGGGGSYYNGTLISGSNGDNQSHGSITITKQ